ncbi:TPA: restriction endonuclease subunit S [Serratia marcescens]|nr:restriction endonuclease subunit S [Serratia marcescens]
MKYNQWQRVKIAELCELIVDCVNKTAPSVDYETPYKMIRTPNIKGGRINLTGCRYVEKETFKKWTRRATVDKGDVLLTREAPMGEVGYVDFTDTVFLGQRIMQYRADPKKLDSAYLLYSFLSPDLQYQFRRHDSTGSIVSHIRVPDCSEFEISLPSLDEQKKIANILRNIDAKIALNNCINAELEAMAKTLYDYWFVQFDFPDVNGKPYKTSGGKMVYNATLKRDIPVGWNLKPILECCDVIDCLHSKKPESNYFSNEHYLLQLENIEDNGLLDMSVKYFVSHDDYINWTSRIEVKQHDIVMTNAGRIAAFAQVPEGIKCGIGRNITAIRPKNIKKNYFFSALSGIDIQSQIANNLDHGAFFKSFNVKGIKLLKIIKTDNGLEDKFESLITPVIEKRQQMQHENQMLKELRDWLLPLLMNGQVTVK